jgi:hypothetical protein
VSTVDERAVSPANGSPGVLAAIDRDAFRRCGYVVVEQLFGSEEIERLRSVVFDTLAEYERDGRGVIDRGREGTVRGVQGDLLSIPSLRHMLLDQRLLGVITHLLGGKPSYFGDSSVRAGKNGEGRGWHRDNVNRKRWRGGPDWKDPYPVLRCGLYMQDQALYSGGLGLRPRSNRPHRLLPTLGKFVKARTGDVVIWDLRTVHSGEVVRVRGFPELRLHPRFQTLLPELMRMPEGRERMVMFMAFGLPGMHLDNYIAYLRARDYMRTAWANSRVPTGVWDQAESAGLDVVRTIPEYAPLG